MTTQRSRRAFTLRFDNANTHTLLALISSRLGVSMNELAEKMIEAELEVASLALQEDLAHTLGLLASYQDDPEADAPEKLEELHKTLEDASDTIDEIQDKDE